MAEVRINDYKLMRARDGRMLAGVAAGLAQASGLDVTLVRLCIGAMVLSGFGVAAYILMWIILPEESPRRGNVIEPAPENTARIIRIALVGLAALSLFNKVGGWGFANPHARGVGFDGTLGLILLGIGIAVLFTRHRPDRALWETTPPPTVRVARDSVPVGDEDDDTPKYAGPFGEAFGTVHDALSDALGEVRTTLSESRPRRAPEGTTSTSVQDAYVDYDDEDDDAAYDDDIYPPRPSSEPTRLAMATGATTRSGGAALVVASIIGWLVLIGWVLSTLALGSAWAAGAVTVRSPVVLGVASLLVLMGVSRTLMHAKFARAVVPALALLLIPIGIATATVRINGEIGEKVITAADVHAGRKNFRHGIGQVDLELADATFTSNTTINVRNGIGAIFVTVPNDVAVTVHARTDAGPAQLFGQQSDGFNARASRSYDGCKGTKRLILNLRTGPGYIDVHRANHHADATCKAA